MFADAPPPEKFKLKPKTAEGPAAPATTPAAVAAPSSPPPFPLMTASAPAAPQLRPLPAARVEEAQAPAEVAIEPKPKRRSPLILALAALLVLGGGGFFAWQQFLREPPPPPPPARPPVKAPAPTPNAPVAKAPPPEVAPATAPAPKGGIAHAPSNAIKKAQASAGAHDQGVKEGAAVITPAPTPTPPPADAPPGPAPTAVSALGSAAVGTSAITSSGATVTTVAPGVVATTDLEVTGNPSSAFRAFVGNARITGVAGGQSPKALLNGKLVRVGETADAGLGISLAGIDVPGKTLLFRDKTGATVTRKY